jgi:hypothetical protein
MAYLCESGQGFIVGVQDMAAALDEVDGDLATQKPGIEVDQVFIEHVVELGCELDARRTATANDE